MRHKSTYFINVPNFADKFFTATVSFLNSKLKSRVKVRYVETSSYFNLTRVTYLFLFAVLQRSKRNTEIHRPQILTERVRWRNTVGNDNWFVADFLLINFQYLFPYVYTKRCRQLNNNLLFVT